MLHSYGSLYSLSEVKNQTHQQVVTEHLSTRLCNELEISKYPSEVLDFKVLRDYKAKQSQVNDFNNCWSSSEFRMNFSSMKC